MLGTNSHGIAYDYDSSYFPQYRPAVTRQLVINGRLHMRRTELTPMTVGGVTVQGMHVTAWTYDASDRIAGVSRTSRVIDAPRTNR